jgi:hypothetical protein
MNSDMDNHSDFLYSRLMNWLLQGSDAAASQPTNGQAQVPSPLGNPTAADFELDRLDLLDVEELNIAPYNTGKAAQSRTRDDLGDMTTREDTELGGSIRPHNLGEMPTVEDRFQALLKRRLKLEIESRPPLFPWETELSDYEPDFPDAVVEGRVPPIRLWMPQLSQLALPVGIPDTVLAQLLDACSEAAYSRRQLGAKLVNVVENLFPNQFQVLNQLAGMVLLYPSRSSDRSAVLPSHYEEASAEQKMTLALLAAKEIIGELTVPVSPQAPVERQWQTSAGVVTVQAEYQIRQAASRLRVTSHLPCGGSLTLQTPQAPAVCQRPYPGELNLEATDIQPNQTYPLEIRLHESEQAPLTLAICPTL